MKKLALILCFICAGSMFMQAQISTGESNASVIRTGNRAEKGDFGLYLGATTDMFQNIIGNGPSDFSALPLINLKYMVTDKVEARLGIEWYKKSEKSDYDGGEYSDNQTSMSFAPGIAYHFNRSNILDVYVGGELPFGWGSLGYEKDIEEGDDEDLSASNFNVGLGAFIGLQAYVCNLPLAIGLEYGISCKYTSVGDGTFTKGYQTVSVGNNEFESNFAPYKDVDNNQFKLGHQARFTLTYFFKL